ncbi:MAG: type II toxin-antitoxin system VapC family toxin [Anaerolineae bacterium]
MILDTDILIDVQRGYAPALAWFSQLEALPVVPGFVVMELIQDAKNSEQVRTALKFVAPLKIIWPTEYDCNQALLYFSKYHLSHKLGLLDALIAACAVGKSTTLCTFNVKHYRAIPELQLLQPYEKPT